MEYFAANDIAAFITQAGTPSEDTTAGRFDATYTSKAILINSASTTKSAQFINPTTGATVSPTDVWLHFEMFNASTGSAGSDVLNILDAAGTPIFRLFFPNTTNCRLDYWNGAAWVVGVTLFACYTGNNQKATFDIHIVAGLAGSINLYVNQSLALTIAGLNAAVDNFAFLLLKGGGFSGGAAFSQILVSDTSTIGAKVASLVPNANSAVNTAWANDYNNINKVSYNDATFISSTTLADNESYGHTAVALPTAQYFVSSVWFAARARLNSASPANIKPLMRIGGVNYAGAYNFGSLDSVSYKPTIAAFVNDPSTGIAWSGITNLNAAEVGYQTAA